MRELRAAAEAADRAAWGRTAEVLNLVYAVNRSSRSPQYAASDWNPYAPKATISFADLKALFEGASKARR